MTFNQALRPVMNVLAYITLGLIGVSRADPGLVGHWPLKGDSRDVSGLNNHGTNHGVKLQDGTFDGVGSYIEVPSSESLKLGTGDFTFSAWVHTEKQLDDIVGDVFDLYDPAARRGVTLSINSTAGGFQSTGTDRHIYFGIDNAKLGEWQACGRPSPTSNYVSESMTVYKGHLYAATTGGKEEKDWRHVYRYDGGQNWIDCGQVGTGKTQGVGPLIVHNGDLYSVTWTVDWTRVPKGGFDPGRVYRYLGGTDWEDCGQPSDSRTLNCVASYGGKLYVGGGPETWGVFTQDGSGGWTPSKVFEKTGPKRCFPHSMAVFNGKLFTGYPVVYTFDGGDWTYAGTPFADPRGMLQLYCFAAHQGRLCVGSWPESNVAYYQGGENWKDIGRVGVDGTEVNGLVVYNGKLYGGSLPRAEVCRYDGDTTWTSLKRFYSPDGWIPGIPGKATRKEVNEWVRLTSLTVYDGKLFASTGSCTSSVADATTDMRGDVFSLEAGKVASYDDDLGSGWKHLVAMRDGGQLKLFVGGKLVARSSSFNPADYDISTDRPLRIGFGQTDYFAGKMSDVRLYNRALAEGQIQQLATQSPVAANDPAVKTARIVVGQNASRVDRFAAAELQRTLQASLGWKTTQSQGDADSAPAGATVFYVGSLDSGIEKTAGCPAIASDQIAALKDDGIILRGDGQRVVLVGRGPRGGLNAVYEFLEEQLAVHWPEPGRELIPQHKSVTLRFDYQHNPAMYYRGIALHGPCTDDFYRQVIDWQAKNRLNSLQFSCEVYDQLRPRILDSILDRGLAPKIGAHSRQYFYSTAKYFPQHSEHFALVKKERTGATQMCYSNHESVAEYANNVVSYLKDHPEIAVVGLWPSDGYGFCECEQCKAGSTTDVLLDYVNDVAERVQKQAPQVKVEFLSYIHYTVPPDKTKPHPNVVPTYCEYRSRNHFHPITDERASNAKCRQQLEDWVKASNQATVYAYYADDIMKRFLYNPVQDVVMADLKYYHSIGAAGSSVLMMNPQSWWTNAPHLYAYARGSWDLTTSLDQINQDYFQSLYGSAAKPMSEHQEAVRAMFDQTFDHGLTGEDILFSFRMKKFKPDQEASSSEQMTSAVRRIRDCLLRAKSSTTDPYVLKKIEILDQDAQLMGQIYGVASEAAGYKVDQQEVRKSRMHDLMAEVSTNQVIVNEDFRCNILKSLMSNVIAVLGADEAAKYDRVAQHPPE